MKQQGRMTHTDSGTKQIAFSLEAKASWYKDQFGVFKNDLQFQSGFDKKTRL